MFANLETAAPETLARGYTEEEGAYTCVVCGKRFADGEIYPAGEKLLDAMDIGLQCYRRAPKETLKNAIREFACKYGLLGLMTALPTTVHFADFKQVYLLKNQFIREEAMDTLEYLRLFFPFEMPAFAKGEKGHILNLTDRTMIALAMTFRTDPQAMVMTFMRNYGERYDWLVEVFRDWAFTFMAAFLYYHDKDSTDETTLEKQLYATKTMDISGLVNLNGAAAPGYEVKSITTSPATLIAAGDTEALKTIDTLFASTAVDISGKDESFAVDLTLRKPGTLTYLSTDTVKVQVEIGPVMITRTFDGLKPAIRNLPEGLAGALNLKSASVTVSGPENTLTNMKASSIKLYADLSGYGEGTFILPLTADFGETDLQHITYTVNPAEAEVTLTAK